MHRKSARSGPLSPLPRPPSLLSLLQVLADGIEELLPASLLTFYPIGGLGKPFGPQREAVRPPIDHARHYPGLLEQLQVPRYRRLRDPEAPGSLAHGGGAAAEPL